ncbi:MAG: accessory gene regulator B family protein [Roseburia sp.]|nr:accessory gene regulator B family protein [Roseburia sp.]
MLQRSSEFIAGWLIRHEAIRAEDRDLYVYAAYNLCFTTIPLLCFLILCGIIGRGMNGAVILISALAIRRYAGGYHARTPQVCVLCSCGLLAICLFGSCVVENGMMVGMAAFIATAGLWILSPVDSENRRLDNEEQVHCRRHARTVALFLFGLYIVFSFFHLSVLAVCIALGILLAGFLQFICIPRLIREYKSKTVE